MRTLLLAAFVALVVAAPAPAAVHVPVTAYGEGDPTTCLISFGKKDWPISDYHGLKGCTDCSRPVQQSAQAWMPQADYDDPEVWSPLCSGLRTDCFIDF